MSQLFVLFEHAAGFGLFKVNEFEEAGMLLPQVEASVTDLARFNSVVKLVGFAPFKSAARALENINSISEGVISQDLKLFLETYMPLPGKKSKASLGVSDPKLGASISEELGISCSHVGAVPEIIRGIRHHFAQLVKGFTPQSSGVAQLGLGHSYSRAKVKFNVNRVDNMIIQSIALLDQLDKDINTFSMRIREWYSYHFPELVKIVPENYLYAKCAKYIKNRKELSEDSLEALEEIVMDSGKAQAILDASRSSMGMDISPLDLINIEMFAVRVVGLADYRKQLSEYLHSKMAVVAPNLGSLIGDQVAARLISHAGSLTNLAKYPASTVQILGAEKALFRALKTKGNTPKYGLIFHSTFIGRAGNKNKGRISRYLANKCSVASRIDCFSEQRTSVFGEKMKQQVEDRLKFFETGVIPKKNIDVMKEAIEEAAREVTKTPGSGKKKKRKSEAMAEENVPEVTAEKKKKRKSEAMAEENVPEVTAEKKKKRKSEAMAEENVPEVTAEKKKKRKSEAMAEENVPEVTAEKKKKKKKKKRKSKAMVEENVPEVTAEKKKKKKKKNKLSVRY